MEWRDEGALVAVRPHGESAAIIEVFTAGHGRHAGIVRGGGSRRMTPILQPGAQLEVEWRARLEEHLGSFRIEPLKSRAATVMNDRLTLYGLGAACALISFALPEREPHPGLYAATQHLFDAFASEPNWPHLYLLWELALLEELGFGLDLSHCAVTGGTEDLAYISPKSGRAVSRAAAGDWADRLLPLPACLTGVPSNGLQDTRTGLTVTGYFLEHKLAPSLADRPLPEARARLVSALARKKEDE